jgi:hypothetical protein
MWKGNIGREYYQQKYMREAQQEIVTTGNLHVHTGGTEEDSSRTMQSVISRLTHDNVDELINSDIGETHARLDDGNDETAIAVKAGITGLIDQYARGDLDDDSFEEEKNRVLQQLARSNPDLLGEGDLFADNLLTVAQNVKAMVRHDRGVADILQDARFDVGRVRTDARTEARYSRVDRVVESIQRTRVGSWLNESTVGAAASIVAAATRLTVQKGVAKAAAVTGVGAVGTAVIAGVRESKRVKDERRRHSREMAAGEQIESGSKRREKMEDTRYETVSATQLTGALDVLFEDSGDSEHRKVKELTEQGFFEAAAIVAQIKARNRISSQQNIDLVHFSSSENIEEERLQMMLTI